VNLFAWTDIPNQQVIRIPLTQALQADVALVFDQQFESFHRGIVDIVDFDGHYTPDEGELLSVQDFPQSQALFGAVQAPLGVPQYDPQTHPLSRMKGLFVGHTRDGVPRVLIQILESRRLLSRQDGISLTMFFSGNVFRKMEDVGLTLDTRLLAVLEGTTLTFESFHFVRRVFDMSTYFNQATDADMRTFAGHANLAVANVQRFIDGGSALIRKKVTLVLQSGVLDRHQPAQIAQAAAAFQVQVQIDAHGKIVIPSRASELRALLRFLDEDYYSSPLSGTHYISNSKRRTQ
jgi:hypothetical protein